METFTERERALLHALNVIVNGATRTMGQDSTGREYAHVRQAMLDVGRETLAKWARPGTPLMDMVDDLTTALEG